MSGIHIGPQVRDGYNREMGKSAPDADSAKSKKTILDDAAVSEVSARLRDVDRALTRHTSAPIAQSLSEVLAIVMGLEDSLDATGPLASELAKWRSATVKSLTKLSPRYTEAISAVDHFKLVVKDVTTRVAPWKSAIPTDLDFAELADLIIHQFESGPMSKVSAHLRARWGIGRDQWQRERDDRATVQKKLKGVWNKGGAKRGMPSLLVRNALRALGFPNPDKLDQ